MGRAANCSSEEIDLLWTAFTASRLDFKEDKALCGLWSLSFDFLIGTRSFRFFPKLWRDFITPRCEFIGTFFSQSATKDGWYQKEASEVCLNVLAKLCHAAEETVSLESSDSECMNRMLANGIPPFFAYCAYQIRKAQFGFGIAYDHSSPAPVDTRAASHT